MNLVKRNTGKLGFPSLLSDWYDAENLFSNMFPEVRSTANLPSVNIKEEDNSFQLEVAAPGLTKNDIKINVDNNILEISAEKKEEKSEEGKNYTRREFNYSSFERSFTLPENVNSENIKAEYKDGILYLNLPKKEISKAKTKKQISIS